MAQAAFAASANVTNVQSRSSTWSKSFDAVLDEVGYYTVEGMAVMAAQARSLGFSLVFATQDIPAMFRINDKEAKSIIANTTTKIFMRVEETELTAKLAIESAGKGFRTQVGSFQGRSGEAQIHYSDSMEARVEQIDRISGVDLRALGPGQCYVTWRDKYFKVQVFHANPEAEYKRLSTFELRANHFIPVKRPNPADLAGAETLPLIAMALADPAHAKALSDEARAARARITDAAAKKVDPSTLRQEIAVTAVGIERALNTSTRGRAPSGNDFIQAACAAIAGVLLGAKRNGETFARDVRETQGLGAGAGLGSGLAAGLSVPPRTAQSGAGLAPSEIPGVSSAAAAAAAAAGARRPAAAPPPPDDDYEEEDAEFASEAFGRERKFADALTDRGPAATAAVLADMDTPSVMRKVDHGVTVGHQVHKLADDIGSNDSTMRMLAALDFEGDPGPDAVDALLEDALAIGEEPPPPPGPPPSAAEIERADRASAAATQWPDRAPKGMPKVHSELGLDDAVKTSNLDMMTEAFLVDALGEEGS